MEKQLKRFIDLLGFRLFLIIVLAVTGFLQFGLMVDNVRSVTYDLSMGSVSPETIRATKTVEDTEKTEQERDNAEQNISAVYDFNSDLANQQATLTNLLFNLAIEAKQQMPKENIVTEAEKLAFLKEKLSEVTKKQNSVSLTNSELLAMINATEVQLKNAQQVVSTAVQNALKQSIRKENVPTARNNVEAVIRTSTIDSGLLDLSIAIARSSISETEVVNEEKTKMAKQQASESIEANKILQGQIVVLEGEIIDQEKYRQLELLGMVDNQSSLKPIIGIAIFILLQLAFFFIYFDRSKTIGSEKTNQLLVAIMIFICAIITMKLISLMSDNFNVLVGFAFPTAMGTMLAQILTNERIASLMTILVAASGGIIFQESYASILQMDVALYILFGGFATLFFMRNVEKRSHILKASAIVMVINMIFIMFYLLMTQSDYGLQEIFFYIVAGILSGLLSGALTLGLLPFFESLFGILSTMRLIELSNPNHPLLKKLLTETPGSYHHSVMVANLAEASCEAIGADGLLARVGCYYHDIGKTRRPAFFIENQMGVNPHDQLPPEASADIILAHTTDGAELLRQHKMPQEIIDIALQHHGTSVIKYFLHKAKEDGEEVNEADFRYPGPKPQTKEAAVISIADSVEAAVRSMQAPNAEKIHKLVQSIIQDRINDNQFDECDISLRELKVIEAVLCESLNGIFHSRIEYPKEKKEN